MKWLIRKLVRWLAPGWVALLCCNCAGSLERARSQPKLGASSATAERCIALDDRRAFFGAAGKTLAILGGASGLSTIATDDERLETGLAIGSMGAAALAAGAVFVSEQAGTSWSRECATR